MATSFELPSWEARVHRAQDYVRAHLGGDLSVDVLARIAIASRFHFSRRFKASTGETPVQFVQRARLERAAYLMQTRPGRELADIALEVGFSSASDFSRVFSQRYGNAPSRWDRHSPLVPVSAEFDDGLAAARLTAPGFAARLDRLPACRLAYVAVRTPFMDNALLEAGYRQLIAWCERAGLDWAHQPLLGWSWDHPDATPLEKIRFNLGFVVPAEIEPSGPVGAYSVDAHPTVEVSVSGPKAHIALAWEHLYDRWLPHARSEPADLPAFKRFRQRPDQIGWDRYDLDCCIALRP